MIVFDKALARVLPVYLVTMCFSKHIHPLLASTGELNYIPSGQEFRWTNSMTKRRLQFDLLKAEVPATPVIQHAIRSENGRTTSTPR